MDFHGRENKKNFWSFYILHYIAMILLMWLMTTIYMPPITVVEKALVQKHIDAFYASPTGKKIHSVIWILIWIVPTSIEVRRLHDTGKSGWYAFFTKLLWILSNGIVTFFTLGFFIFIYNEKGEKGPNEYGPEPTTDPSTQAQNKESNPK